MLTNDRIQRLITVDHDGLVALLCLSFDYIVGYESISDPDLQSLLDATGYEQEPCATDLMQQIAAYQQQIKRLEEQCKRL